MDPYTSSCDPPTIIERGDKFVDQTASPITRIQMQSSLDFFKLQNATVQYVGKARLPLQSPGGRVIKQSGVFLKMHMKA